MSRRTFKSEAIITSPLLSPRHVDDIREQIPDLIWAGDPCTQNSPTKISVKLPELQSLPVPATLLLASQHPSTIHNPHSSNTSHLLRTRET